MVYNLDYGVTSISIQYRAIINPELQWCETLLFNEIKLVILLIRHIHIHIVCIIYFVQKNYTDMLIQCWKKGIYRYAVLPHDFTTVPASLSIVENIMIEPKYMIEIW